MLQSFSAARIDRLPPGHPPLKRHNPFLASMIKIRNWSQTVSSTPRVLHHIDTADDLALRLREATSEGASVRILGAAQSPNAIAMSDDHLLVIRGLNRILSIDRDRQQVTAEAGVTLETLTAALHDQGLALPTLSSILRQTLAGAAATGTHGTGLHTTSLPSWIESTDLLTPAGDLLHADASNPDLLAAARLSLGSLGVHTSFRLNVVPDFGLRVEEGPIPLEQALDPAWYGAADYARIWYLPYVNHAWGWRAWRTPAQPRRPRTKPNWFRDRLLGYHAFQAGLWLAASVPPLLPAVNRAYSSKFLTQPKASTANSIDQFTFDCLFHQHVTEWAVPLPRVLEAVLATRDLAEREGFRAHLPIEIRFTAADDVWLSPTFGQPRCWIGILSYIPYGREIEWRPFFTAFEHIMHSLEGRPHWAKHFTLNPEDFRQLYRRWDDFQHLRRTLDPQNRLRNPYTTQVFST